jgi:hypothetical protein
MGETAKRHHYAGVVCKSVYEGRSCGLRNYLRTLESPLDNNFGWFGDASRLLKCLYCNHDELYSSEDLVIWELDFEPGFGLGLPMDKGRFGNP